MFWKYFDNVTVDNTTLVVAYLEERNQEGIPQISCCVYKIILI